MQPFIWNLWVFRGRTDGKKAPIFKIYKERVWEISLATAWPIFLEPSDV